MKSVFSSSLLLPLTFFSAVASAGLAEQVATPLKVTVGEQLVLDPSDGLAVGVSQQLVATWSWDARPAASVASFSDPAVLRPKVTVDVPGRYVANLALRAVGADPASTPLYTTTLEFGTQNLKPVAQVVARGVPGSERPLVLDGSGSYDVDGDLLTYQWSVIAKPTGSSIDLSGASGAMIDFAPDVVGTYELGLTVTDAQGNVSQTADYAVVHFPGETSKNQYRPFYDRRIVIDPSSAGQTIDLGDLRVAGQHIVVDGFRLHRASQVENGTPADSMNFIYRGLDHTLSSGVSFLAFVSYLEHDLYLGSNARIAPNEAVNDLTFELDDGHGSITFRNIMVPHFEHDLVLLNGADFYQGFAADKTKPEAAFGFDQFAVPTAQAVELDPFASVDVDGTALASEMAVVVRPASSGLTASVKNDRLTASPDVAGDYLVSLSVSDGTFRDDASLIVSSGPEAQVRPVARIAQVASAAVGSEVKLDGTQSYDFDGELLSYQWAIVSRPAASTVGLSQLASPFSAFTPDVEGTYVVQLSVKDARGVSKPVTQVIQVADTLPVARAGADILTDTVGQVTLDGAASSFGAGAVTNWSVTGLIGADVYPTPAAADQIMTPLSLSRAKRPLIEVLATQPVYHQWGRPHAACHYDTRVPSDLGGDHSIVTLWPLGKFFGTAGEVKFAWAVKNAGHANKKVDLVDSAGGTHGSLVVPGNTSVLFALDSIGAKVLKSKVNGFTTGFGWQSHIGFSRVADVCTGPVDTVAQFIVADANGISLPDTVYAGTGNIRPVLTRSAQVTVTGPQTINLNAADYGFDANGDQLSYAWSLLYRPENSKAALASTVVDGAQLAFEADRSGIYLLQATAVDGALDARPVVIVVEVLNSPPVAVVAGIADVFVGETATLDGSASSDPEGDTLTYKWTVVSRPDGSTAQIADPFAPIVAFTPDKRGSYEFKLVVSDYELSSQPATATLNVPNRTPIAKLDGPDSSKVGEDIILDASGSSDPDNDDLTIGFNVVAAPAASKAVIGAVSPDKATFTPDVVGDYRFEVVVDDGESQARAEITTKVIATSSAPVMSDLDDSYSVEVGLTLRIQLDAMDPDGNQIDYFAQPLPLPAGMTLDAASGVLSFTPTAGQEGQIQLSLGASDGVQTTSQTIKIVVLPADGGQTAISGVVLDAQDYVQGISTPVANVPVRLTGANLEATTDAQGRFNFGSLTAGADVLQAVPNNAGAAVAYGAEVRSVTAVENQELELSKPILLTRLQDGCAQVVSGQATEITGSSSSLTVEIPADSVTDVGGNPYTGQICLGSLPRLFEHPGFSDGVQACQIYALDAPGAVFTKPVLISAPNVDELPVGAKAVLWQQQQGFAQFAPIGSAPVLDGGTRVGMTSVDIEDGSSLFAFLPQVPLISASADQPDGMKALSMFSGNLAETFDMVSYQGFSRPQSFVLRYNSATADPRVVVAGDVSIAKDAGLPVSISGQVSLGGLTVKDVPTWNPRLAVDGATPALVGEALTMRQSAQIDVNGLTTGRYGYKFQSKAKYACSTVVSQFSGKSFVQSSTESEFGSGWAVDGLQKLIDNGDGSVSIADDDSVTTFEPKNSFAKFDGGSVVIPASHPISIALADFDKDGKEDIAIGESGPGNISIVRNFGDRDFKKVSSYKVADVRQPRGSDPDPKPDITSIVAIDFDQDGNVDVPFLAQFENVFGALKGDGAGSFKSESLFNPQEAYDLVVVDLDQDGYKDVVYGGTQGFFTEYANVQTFFGGPNGFTKVKLEDFGEGGFQRWIAPIQTLVTDIDGDGLLDVAIRSTRGIHYMLQGNGRKFTEVTTDLANDGYFLLGQKMQFSDVDGDGKKELFTVTKSGLKYYPNLDGRSFGDPVNIPLPADTINGGNFFLRDVDGDGREDLIHSSRSLNVYRSLGNGQFAPPVLSSINHRISGRFAISDIDQDGALDLVSMQGGEEGSVTIDFSRADEDGTLIATDGEFSELKKMPDGTWQRRYKDGLVVIFDQNGRQTAEVDPRGNRREFVYDPQGRLAEIVDQNGEKITMSYTPAGLVGSITYPDGRETVLSQNPAKGLEYATYPDGTEIRYRYDDEGRLVAVTDERGKTTEHRYNKFGNYTGTTYPDGSTIANKVAASVGLDDLGNGQPLSFVKPEDRVAEHVDAKGNSTIIRLNKFGSIIQTVDPLKRETNFVRNEKNLVTSVERATNADPAFIEQAALPSSWFIGSAFAQQGGGGTIGGTIYIRRDEMEYDERGNLTVQRLAANSAQPKELVWTYDPDFNRVTSATDFDGFTTTYTYNQFGELVKTVDAEGNEASFTYNLLGLRESMIDERGNATGYTYNDKQNLLRETRPDGSIVEYSYDNRGNVVRLTEALGLPEQRTIVREYDSRDRLLSQETLDANGASIDGKMTYTYDAAGNLTANTDETGLSTTYVYDDRNQQIEISVPGYGTSTYEYNFAGELIKETDPEGHSQSWTFDKIGRITGMEDAVGNTSAYVFDIRDNIVRVTDGRGNLTAFTHDIFDRVKTRTNPIGQTIAMKYDKRDNLIKIIREDNSEETAVYDKLSRRTKVTTADNVLNYSYDQAGNILTAGDNDSLLTMTYDSRDRLETVTTDGTVGPQPAVTLNYTYNARGERQTLSDSLGGTWSYAFDERSRVQTLTAPWLDVHTMDYDKAGRRTVLANSKGRQTKATYAQDRLAQLEHFQNSVAIAQSGYAYSDDGQLAVETDQITPEQSRSYAYDASNRLTMVSRGVPTSQGGTPVPEEDYAYDEAGNRTVSHQSSVYTVDAHNRLLEDAQFTYGYDTKGNRTSRTNKTDGVVESYVYNSMNQLTSIQRNGAEVASYAYDALGRRIAKTVAGQTEAYVYDIGSMYDLTGHDRLLDFSNGALSKRWLHGQNIDEPVAFEAYGADTTPGAGSVYALHADRQGSVIAVTDQATGALAARYRYDAFGVREQVSGSAVQDRGFTGREFDAESGLYYYRARHYDPVVGRFLQSDPLGFAAGDLNLYAYTWNDPTNWTDPSGLSPTAEKSTLDRKNAALAADVVSTVQEGAECLSNKIGTYLKDLGKIRAAGGDFSEISTMTAGCVVRAVAPVDCLCQRTGRKKGGGSLTPSSFPAGTEVLTPTGPVAIETLREGDLVVARDEETGVSGVFPVTALMSRTSPGVIWLTLESAEGETSRMGVTSEHPLFVVDQGWTDAGAVVPGDEIRNAYLRELSVLAVTVDKTPARVHNLEIATAHTYFVGELQAWGHNARKKKDGAYYANYGDADYAGDSCDLDTRSKRSFRQRRRSAANGKFGVLLTWVASDARTARVWQQYLIEGMCEREGVDHPSQSNSIQNKINGRRPN